MKFVSYKKEDTLLQNVYISCIRKDYNRYFKVIAEKILAVQNCNIYYLDNNDICPSNSEEIEDYKADLKSFDLFIFLISPEFLNNKNIFLDIDVMFARENNFPILPIFVEYVIPDVYSIKFGTLQALDINSIEIDENSFDNKFKKYIKSVFVSDENVIKIRDAFNAYIFLSYRKKDKKHAQEIMSLIHKNNFMRDVAIWYDENLTPGRDFNDEIKAIMEKSDIISFIITPNIMEKDNYVLTVEYPEAINSNKVILPIETVDTNKEMLNQRFRKLPSIINKNNEDELSNRLKELMLKEGFVENNDPEHLYFIGLAYLNAIDVERNPVKAIELLKESASQKYIPAIKELIDIYENGKGVLVNYQECIKWQSILSKMCDDKEEKLDSMIDLAYFYSLDGQIELAKTFNEKCYEMSIEVFGIDSLYTLTSLNNLALSYYDFGDYEKSLLLSQECYEHGSKLFGDNHQLVLTSLGNIASIYADLGNYEKSKELNQKCYEIKCSIFGQNHPATLHTLLNLANSYFCLRDYEKSKELNQKCFENSTILLGENHPDTLDSLNNLASCYSRFHNYEKSNELYQKCYKKLSIVLGDNHPKTLTALFNLAESYSDLSNYERSNMLHHKCYEARLRILGENHLDTIASLEDLAISYDRLRNYEKSYELNQILYSLKIKNLGENHPSTLITLNNLADDYFSLGNYSKSIELYEKCFKKCLKILGERNQITLNTMCHLMTVYLENSLYSKAVEIGEKYYKIFFMLYSKNHPDASSFLNNLSYAHYYSGNYSKANELAKKCYDLNINKENNTLNILNSIDLLIKINIKINNSKEIDRLENLRSRIIKL